MLDQLLQEMAAAHRAMNRSVPLHVGLSALCLELLFRHALGDNLKGKAFQNERRTMLAEAARTERLRVAADAKTFEPPLPRENPDAFLDTLHAQLKGRLPKRKVFREAVAALHEAGLPEEAWLYVEPQMDRYARFRGRLKKALVKAALALLARAAPETEA